MKNFTPQKKSHVIVRRSFLAFPVLIGIIQFAEAQLVKLFTQ
jgi:hypothetical protein